MPKREVIEGNHLGKVVRALRRASGEKAKDFAQRAGIKPNYLSLIENDRVIPSWDTLQKIADATDFPVWKIMASAELFGDDVPPEVRESATALGLISPE